MPLERMQSQVWILGATGRIGSDVAKRLDQQGITTVLVGRNKSRLDELDRQLSDNVSILTISSVKDIAAKIRQSQPALVINTIGPFSQTVPAISRACLPHSNYVDIANDVVSTLAILELHQQAKTAGKTLVSGAGFGVLATESAVLKLCQDAPPAETVRTDDQKVIKR